MNIATNVAVKISMLALGTLSLGTAIAGTSKAVSAFNTYKPEVKEIQEYKGLAVVSDAAGVEEPEIIGETVTGDTTIATTVAAEVVSSSEVVQPTVVPTPSSPQPSSTACIITLYGKQYDVTSLRNSHPGGDVFACGTDQTTVYQNQHGSNVSSMQRYLVTGNGTTGTSSSTNISGSSSAQFSDDAHENEIEDEQEDEDESEEHQLEEEFERAKQEWEDENEHEDD